MYDVAYPCWNTDLIPIQDARAANLALGVGQEERFFNKLEDDVSRIIQQEKRREQYANSQGQEVNTSTEHEPVGRPVLSGLSEREQISKACSTVKGEFRLHLKFQVCVLHFVDRLTFYHVVKVPIADLIICYLSVQETYWEREWLIGDMGEDE